MLPGMTADPVEQLSRALEVTGVLVAGVASGQWDGPTPCTEMTVRELVAHLVAGNYVFTEILRGTPLRAARAAGARVAPDSDLVAEYGESSARLLAAYREPGVLEKDFVIPAGEMPGIQTLHIRIVEMLVHGWDLARATGQAAEFPDELAEQEIRLSAAKLNAMPPDLRPFDPPQPVPAQAPAIDRLAALLGRRVSAAPRT
jgi:uncharacterized protein (TIGR03086 family)